jgi:uncharacterized Zn finger protein
MACPVCDGTERTVVNVRMHHDSDLEQLAKSTWDGRNVARCDGCGVLYDHRHAADDDETVDGPPDETVNCPECGSLTAAGRDTCSYCEAPLDDASR